MLRLKLTETAKKGLLRFNHPEQKMIAKKLRYLAENFSELKRGKKVTELKGSEGRHYRYVIARRIRAIFEVREGEMILLVLKIGRRKDIYD